MNMLAGDMADLPNTKSYRDSTEKKIRIKFQMWKKETKNKNKKHPNL